MLACAATLCVVLLFLCFFFHLCVSFAHGLTASVFLRLLLSGCCCCTFLMALPWQPLPSHPTSNTKSWVYHSSLKLTFISTSHARPSTPCLLWSLLCDPVVVGLVLTRVLLYCTAALGASLFLTRVAQCVCVCVCQTLSCRLWALWCWWRSELVCVSTVHNG